jgi:hypothetical protein
MFFSVGAGFSGPVSGSEKLLLRTAGCLFFILPRGDRGRVKGKEDITSGAKTARKRRENCASIVDKFNNINLLPVALKNSPFEREK